VDRSVLHPISVACLHPNLSRGLASSPVHAKQRQDQEEHGYDKIEANGDEWRYKCEDHCKGAHPDGDPALAVYSSERVVGKTVDPGRAQSDTTQEAH
jgi:hypothetical protein